MWTIWRREIGAFLNTPPTYTILAVFSALNGWVFLHLVRENLRTPQSLQALSALSLAFWLPLLIGLATMRLFAEERATGTIESLLTAPVRDVDVVLGKYLAALLFVLAVLACGLVPLAWLHARALRVQGFGWTGLVGAAWLLFWLTVSGTAVGVLASLCTRYQAVAVMTTVAVLMAPHLAFVAVGAWMPAWRHHSGGPPLDFHLLEAARGTLDIRLALRHASIAVGALFAGVRILESRLWRV